MVGGYGKRGDAAIQAGKIQEVRRDPVQPGNLGLAFLQKLFCAAESEEALPRRSSLNVASAVTGVRSSWEASAMNLLSASRSWRRSWKLVSRWDAIALSWPASAPISSRRPTSARAARSPSDIRRAVDASARSGSDRALPMMSPNATAMSREPKPENRTAFLMVPMASELRLKGVDICTNPMGSCALPTGRVTVSTCRGGTAAAPRGLARGVLLEDEPPSPGGQDPSRVHVRGPQGQVPEHRQEIPRPNGRSALRGLRDREDERAPAGRGVSISARPEGSSQRNSSARPGSPESA